MESPLNAIKMPDALSQRDLRISSVNAKVLYKKWPIIQILGKIILKQVIMIENFIFTP